MKIFENLVTSLMKLKSISKKDADKLAREKAPDLAKMADDEKRGPKFDYKADKAKRDEEKALAIAEQRIKRGEEILIAKAKADVEEMKYRWTKIVSERVHKLMTTGPKMNKRRAEMEVQKNHPYEWQRSQEEKKANG